MEKNKLWDNSFENEFFKEALENFASPEQLFYKLKDGYFAYIPKGFDSEGQTLQSRNSLIGKFTEKWCKDLLQPIAEKNNLFAINGVICEELGLTRQSPADVAFCTKDAINQRPEDIKLIFEVKMSIVSNYKYNRGTNKLECIGDFKSHKGNPSLLRSDSMLKAIGKSINIRVSGPSSTKIPIIVLGNSPITINYEHKVDFLKTSGVIQGFWSLNPHPTKSDFIKNSQKNGFKTIVNINMLGEMTQSLIKKEMNYFSSMISNDELGRIIAIANQEENDISKAEKFLSLINTQ